MDAPPPVASAIEQATVTARILGIILNEVALLDHGPDLAGSYHSFGSRHLPNRVRQEEQTLRGGAPDSFNDLL